MSSSPPTPQYFLDLVWAVLGMRLVRLWFGNQRALKAASDVRLSFVPGNAEQFPLDIDWLNSQTALFRDAGFEQLGDLEVQATHGADEPGTAGPLADPNSTQVTTARIVSTGFQRVFGHREHGCVGLIQNTNHPIPRLGRNFLVRWVTVISYAGTGEDDWSYNTFSDSGDWRAIRGGRLPRPPRKLATRVPGNQTPEDLLRLHLKRREAIAIAAGVTWDRSPSLEDVIDLQHSLMLGVGKLLAKYNPISISVKLTLLRIDWRKEWLGESEGRV